MQWEEEDFQKKWDFTLWKRLGKYLKPYVGAFVLLIGVMMATIRLAPQVMSTRPQLMVSPNRFASLVSLVRIHPPGVLS